MTNWGPSGLAMPGQSFADSKRDGSVSAASLSDLEAALNGSRRVYLQGPKVGHGCAHRRLLTVFGHCIQRRCTSSLTAGFVSHNRTPIYDRQIPRQKDGTPIYSLVWEYLLTSTAQPGTTIPEEAVPCCCIDARMGQGSYAPRNCSRAVGASDCKAAERRNIVE